MKTVLNFSKIQEKVVQQWATVVNAFVSCLFPFGKFTLPRFLDERGGGGSVKGASNNKMLNLDIHFGQHSL